MKTKTTDLSRFNRCLIRRKLVANTPEERVRQALLRTMVELLGYPRSLISVERGIGARRTDIVCYTPDMLALLLVECKAEAIDESAIEQALGYNEQIGAPFVCVASANNVLTLWFENKKRVSVPFLPKFRELSDATGL